MLLLQYYTARTNSACVDLRVTLIYHAQHILGDTGLAHPKHAWTPFRQAELLAWLVSKLVTRKKPVTRRLRAKLRAGAFGNANVPAEILRMD